MSKLETIMAELKEVKGIDWMAMFKKRYNIHHAEIVAMVVHDEVQDQMSGVVEWDDCCTFGLTFFRRVIEEKISLTDALAQWKPKGKAEKAVYKFYKSILDDEDLLETINDILEPEVNWHEHYSIGDTQWYFFFAIAQYHLFCAKGFPAELADAGSETCSYAIADYLSFENLSDMEDTGLSGDTFIDFLIETFKDEYEPADKGTQKQHDRFCARITAMHNINKYNLECSQLPTPLLLEKALVHNGLSYDLDEDYETNQDQLEWMDLNAITQNFISTADNVVNREIYAAFLLDAGYHHFM